MYKLQHCKIYKLNILPVNSLKIFFKDYNTLGIKIHLSILKITICLPKTYSYPKTKKNKKRNISYPLMDLSRLNKLPLPYLCVGLQVLGVKNTKGGHTSNV